METKEIKLKRLEIEANTINSIRNTYINILALLIGGICGLFFLPFSHIQIILLSLGISLVFFFIVLVINCIKQIQAIILLIRKMEE